MSGITAGEALILLHGGLGLRPSEPQVPLEPAGVAQTEDLQLLRHVKEGLQVALRHLGLS